MAAQRPTPDSLPHDSSVIEVDRIVVRVARPVATTGGASAYVADLDSLRAMQPVPTMDEVLREMPLVQVRANSRGESQLTLRGAGERQVAVLVDGVPLTLGWDHRTDLSVLPMTAARSITLVRGLSSVLHGPNVLGGVVEVGVARSADPVELPEPTRFMGSVDQLGGHTVGAVTATTTALGSGSLKLRAGGGYRSRPGFARSHGLPDPFVAGDTRVNSDLRHVDGFVAARYAGDGGQWASFSASGFDAERGVPPELHTDKPRFWRYPDTRRMVAALSAGTGDRSTGLGTGDLEMSVGLDLGHTHIDDYASVAYDQIQQTELDDDRTLTFRALAEHTLGGGAQIRAAATFADIRHDEAITDLTTGERYPGLYAQRLWSVGSELSWHMERPGGAGTISGGRLSTGLVLDGSDTPETAGAPSAGTIREWGGRLGATLMVFGDDMLLHAAVSRRGRFPALR
ncbi:MAG: TonB-dependent receptor plug domain-containing protein, partial [Gemmatimonadota bacterium]